MAVQLNKCHNDDGRPSRIAVYLSAFVYPGAGQFAQRRPVAGLFYVGICSVAVVFLMMAILKPLFQNMRLLMESAGTGKEMVLNPIPFIKILAWFGVILLVYIAGLLDTVIYQRRRRQD